MITGDKHEDDDYDDGDHDEILQRMQIMMKLMDSYFTKDR